jgi:hypothetical protein
MKIWSRFALAILAACITLGLCSVANAADRLENIPLEFSPTSPMSERTPVDLKGLEGVKLQVDPFTDQRDDPALIGRNVNSATPRKVTTKENVPRFVTYHVKTLLSGLGVDVVENGGTVILKGEVMRFFAEETNRYNATVELRITVEDPAGKMLWAVSTTGTSSRFGLPYKGANYYEVLSDALIGAVHEAANNPNFKKALSGR